MSDQAKTSPPVETRKLVTLESKFKSNQKQLSNRQLISFIAGAAAQLDSIIARSPEPVADQFEQDPIAETDGIILSWILSVLAVGVIGLDIWLFLTL